ncbi:MAG: hypothetical protein F9Y92_05960 [Thermoplasmatales archaeon]|nr:hypothetical protein [Thermoplasmatales archaeon]
MSFRLGDVCPELRLLLQKIKQDYSFSKLVSNYKYYFALLYSNNNTYPFYKTNVNKNHEIIKQYNILEANDYEIDNKQIGFLIASKNIPVIVKDLSKFDFSKLHKFEYKTNLYLYNNGLLYADNYNNILKTILQTTNIKYKGLTSTPGNEKDIYDSMLVINRYYLMR